LTTAIDIFAGIGGWDIAMQYLGIQVLMAANHSQPSLDTNRLNFPTNGQANIDIMTCDPSMIPDADIMTASPECTFQSTASGVRLKNQQQMTLPGWTDRSEEAFISQSRETMNGVHRWASIKLQQWHPFKMIFLENVPELRLWAGMERWYRSMEELGYRHQTISFNSMFARSFPCAVPQSRDRCYIVLWLHNLPKPNMDIRPLAYCHHCHKEIAAIQCWRRYEPYGDYGRQYDYRCACCAHVVAPHYSDAQSIIDWSLPVERIGDRAKPLCANTLTKIEQGIKWLEKQGGQEQAFLMSYYGNAVYRRVSDPVGTVTTKDRHALIIVAPSRKVEDSWYRMFDLEEYKKAMGIPNWYKFDCTKTQALRQLGLAVTPAAAVEVLSRGIAVLDRENALVA
jgi:DNA (cytosine-5)-methyltransferase 1